MFCKLPKLSFKKIQNLRKKCLKPFKFSFTLCLSLCLSYKVQGKQAFVILPQGEECWGEENRDSCSTFYFVYLLTDITTITPFQKEDAVGRKCDLFEPSVPHT